MRISGTSACRRAARASRQEPQVVRGRHRGPSSSPHLGPHHRRLPAPPVHENPGDRPDEGKRGGRSDQDPADRGWGPGPAAREDLRHPQHERGSEDAVPDRGYGLAIPQLGVIPVNQPTLHRGHVYLVTSVNAVGSAVSAYWCHCFYTRCFSC